MWIEELWRYPVKSMAGERLKVANVEADGIRGDRRVLVANGDRIITARTHPRLLAHRVTVGSDGEPIVDGQPWHSSAVQKIVRDIAGASARLVAYDGPERFDVLPILVATDGAIAALGEDRRRLRPNIIIGGVTGLAERSWQGKRLRIRDVVIQIRDLRKRCVMTTFDPDTLEQRMGVLRKIVREFDGSMALNCSVLVPGTIREGDDVTLES